MKTARKALSVGISVVLWLVILLAALYSFTTLATKDDKNVANLFGFTPMLVKSPSMNPTFDAGDLIIIKKCDTESLKENDIITFHTIINNEYALNTHRIIKIENIGGARTYTTKGDNNDIADLHVIVDADIVGKYVGRVPLLGPVLGFLSSSTGFLVVIVLPMLLFFIYQVYHLVMVGISLKKAVALEEAIEVAQQEEAAASKLAEAQAALEEAKRLKAEAEAQLAMANAKQTEKTEEQTE